MRPNASRPVLIGSAVAAVVLLAVVAGTGRQAFGQRTFAPSEIGAATSVVVQPMPDVLVCPPAARLPEGADVGDAEFGAMPVDTTTSVAAGATGLLGAPANWSPLGGPAYELQAGPGAAVMRKTPDYLGPNVLMAAPAARERFAAAASIASVTTAGDLRGLAAASCTPPALSQWIVGGSTVVGASSMLTVSNPGEHSALVTLRAYGIDGPIVLGGQGQFPVAGGAAVAVRMEALAPGQELIAINITSTGSRVAASLQTQRLGGLTPLGTEMIEPVAAPASRLAIVGLTSAGPGADAPEVRLLAPGEAATTARLTVIGEAGPISPPGFDTIRLEPGRVTDVALGGLPAGGFAVIIDADAPVLAAASMRMESPNPGEYATSDSPVDIAWIVGQPLAAGHASSLIAIPSGATATVAIVNAGQARTEATLRVIDFAGQIDGEIPLALEPSSLMRATLDGVFGPEVAWGAILVELDAPDALALSWGVELAADDGMGQGGRLISWLGPRAGVEDPGNVTVREQRVVVE